jgi:hypothetical protein
MQWYRQGVYTAAAHALEPGGPPGPKPSHVAGALPDAVSTSRVSASMVRDASPSMEALGSEALATVMRRLIEEDAPRNVDVTFSVNTNCAPGFSSSFPRSRRDETGRDVYLQSHEARREAWEQGV